MFQPHKTSIVRVLAACLVAGCAPTTPVGEGPVPEPGVPDGLTVVVGESYYRVRGETTAALNGALALAAPRHRGRRAYGLTSWNLQWRYRASPATGGCRVADPEMRLILTTRLPRWGGRDRAPRSVAADWDLFLSRLRHHETGHRQVVIREAARAMSTLGRLREPTCEELRRTVDEVVARAEDRMWEANRDYDRSTDFGLSQAVEMAPGR